MARKCKYDEWLTEDGLKRIEGWARDGLTDLQICKNMGVHKATFCDWKNKFSELGETLKKGRAPVDLEVENALLKSALGYKVTVRKPIKVKEEKQKPGVGKVVTERIEYAEEEVYIAPNTIAQIFWLKNRKPQKWKDKQTVEADTTALDKLDAILRETREAAKKSDDELEYITEEEVFKDTEELTKEE